MDARQQRKLELMNDSNFFSQDESEVQPAAWSSDENTLNPKPLLPVNLVVDEVIAEESPLKSKDEINESIDYSMDDDFEPASSASHIADPFEDTKKKKAPSNAIISKKLQHIPQSNKPDHYPTDGSDSLSQ